MYNNLILSKDGIRLLHMEGYYEFDNHYPQLKSIKDYAFYYDDVKTFLCFHILEYYHRQDESEQQIS